MDREIHLYFFSKSKEIVVILQREIAILQKILESDPSWMHEPEVRRKTEVRLRVTREHLADHQKDMVIHTSALKR